MPRNFKHKAGVSLCIGTVSVVQVADVQRLHTGNIHGSGRCTCLEAVALRAAVIPAKTGAGRNLEDLQGTHNFEHVDSHFTVDEHCRGDDGAGGQGLWGEVKE